SIARKRPFEGHTLRQWRDRLDANTRARITGGIRQGIADGRTVTQIARALRGTQSTPGVIEVSAREMRTIVHTATQHVTTQAREDVFKQNADVVGLVKWSATLDLSTCPICASYDGRTWEVGHGER